ncbi:type II toxin-antitoxin system PemK/MazF family toxin [Clostridium botulinum D/C]|uniref:type II toxin-antitoxin system PemK/MazF family toxin n=1 Tax=Clostridium botulinum TaxID=1491 RepID=UPI001E34A62E|nr:type II toxin-antitoxin system PemK/MazF family toxin [Clostridium botulinum]MCD3350611.1 type II toxin-antitoxin system PemK/MazF family toxin [Clostridium botulinum D/C]MCD3359629.1 type II toxin-antitoxin system PemK/MazF family toxin [Clostridium botulinum D/C]MCD3362731.1 type II toxin-antitoxin system PemK/MazF family toxin [Clostridium botulinum D/C]MCD3365326.1 type II toxin-antitoxin system PemK/MazF family toxin [Clostridium botulinum D/C]
MERFIRGDVVVVPFQFSDLSQSKKRPALVLADLKGSDLILSQITSQNIYDSYSVKLQNSDFEQGTLMKNSNIRPNKIFTADKDIILYKIGHLTEEKIEEVVDKIIKIFIED